MAHASARLPLSRDRHVSPHSHSAADVPAGTTFPIPLDHHRTSCPDLDRPPAISPETHLRPMIDPCRSIARETLHWKRSLSKCGYPQDKQDKITDAVFITSKYCASGPQRNLPSLCRETADSTRGSWPCTHKSAPPHATFNSLLISRSPSQNHDTYQSAHLSKPSASLSFDARTSMLR